MTLPDAAWDPVPWVLRAVSEDRQVDFQHSPGNPRQTWPSRAPPRPPGSASSLTHTSYVQCLLLKIRRFSLHSFWLKSVWMPRPQSWQKTQCRANSVPALSQNSFVFMQSPVAVYDWCALSATAGHQLYSRYCAWPIKPLAEIATSGTNFLRPWDFTFWWKLNPAMLPRFIGVSNVARFGWRNILENGGLTHRFCCWKSLESSTPPLSAPWHVSLLHKAANSRSGLTTD